MPACLEKTASVKVNASLVFSTALKTVEGAVEMLRPHAEGASASLSAGADAEQCIGLKAVLDSFLKAVEIRARLAADQGKVLSEMQKDLNRTAIERCRIEQQGAASLDVNAIPADAIRAALAEMG